ncbi:MAG: hypothetical protein M2R45_03699 [Verrucomicrobia subdivision 3 bacterium]|nr:hypothetical protein [Limisphaerales bacterium]MCS1414982.1 hypothetical protein [Limisphaerales bacterium]
MFPVSHDLWNGDQDFGNFHYKNLGGRKFKKPLGKAWKDLNPRGRAFRGPRRMPGHILEADELP